MILKLAEQAPEAVLVHPFGLLHPHVHGHVPVTSVGSQAAQVGVGVTYELNTGLHVPLIHAALAMLHSIGDVLVHPSVLLHHQVEFCPQLLATLVTDAPTEQAN